jgi:hypothetical protein
MLSLGIEVILLLYALTVTGSINMKAFVNVEFSEVSWVARTHTDSYQRI